VTRRRRSVVFGTCGGEVRKSWLWENSVTLATLVMAVTAVAALVYAHLQIIESRRAQQEANANELWRETLRLGFENSKLSDPTLKLADFDYEKLTIDGSRELLPGARARWNADHVRLCHKAD
jgi:hypothetical protein